MLVSVTGGTGFVGAHTVAAMVRAGHRVRLIARDESAVEGALTPLDVPLGAVDVLAGDVLDETAVERAMRGADAAVHMASVYSFDSRQRGAMRRTNERGTELVLAAARRSVAGPIVYVSTVGAMFPAREISESSPVGRPRETYLATKAAAEVVARRHQEEGVPVVITYPPALLGPNDPKVGDQAARLRNVLRGLMPIWPLGGFPLGDVRDTAALHASLLSSTGPGRHFGPGHYVSTRDYVRAVREVTGRALPAVFLPAWSVVPVGVVTDLVQRIWPWRIPAEYGAVYTAACRTRVAEGVSTNGIPARPLLETFTDTVRWLYSSGLVSERVAGAAILPEVVTP